MTTPSQSKETVVIYHADCTDGFGAAWAVWKAKGNSAEYVSARYGDAPPDVMGKTVIIVDFSYPLGVIEKMVTEAHEIIILDHHKTAQEAVGQLLADGVVAGEFDMARSGAVMAWDYFFPTVPLPQILIRVQDRDLWKYEYADSRAVHAAIASRDWTFETWDEMAAMPIASLADEGNAILRWYNKKVQAVIDSGRYMDVIAGHRVPVCCCPHFMASDVGNILADGHPFAATYSDSGRNKRSYSLRSSSDGIDVSEVAKKFGGGGHKHAAGFSLSVPVAIGDY